MQAARTPVEEPTLPPRGDLEMEQIGEYLVRRLVGEGGMGRVYEAEERLTRRRVALKVMREELSRSEHARALFVNEMQILAHLEHPNIVRSLASVEADGQLVTVLEFLDGRTLRSVLTERGRLPWEEAGHIVLCVAKALVAAHGQEPPVIHRDLKPENIMVLQDGTVKVMDFGIAKLVQELNQTNTQSVGTLQYMSPEQIDAQTVDHRSDLYCLGLVFYELLTGQPPFTSTSPRALLNAQCTDAPPPFEEDVRAEVSKGVQRLVLRLLEKAPEDRLGSAAELVEELEMFLPERSLRGKSGDAPRSGRTRKTEHATPPPAAGGAKVSPTVAMDEERPPERKDTIALVERASGARELSTGVSLGVILLLTAAAGVATYFWRVQAAETPPEPAPAAAPATS